MDWINHPGFVPIRDAVIAQLTSRIVHFRKVNRVIFLCGGFQSSRRDRVAQYIRAHHEHVLLFYADDVWALVAQHGSQNALGMERELAALSDVVLIVVESPGTFAELGAFALQDDLRKKLLPILDVAHRDAESFVRSGPVAWVDEDSTYRPAIWADHDTILDVVDELDARLTKLPSSRAHRVEELAESPKHLVFFLADLVGIFGPCPKSHLAEYVRRILGREPVWTVDMLLGLASAMGLVEHLDSEVGETLFVRPLTEGELRPFQETRYLDLAALRAQVVGAMLGIPGAFHMVGEATA